MPQVYYISLLHQSIASGACITIALRTICDQRLSYEFVPVYPYSQAAACMPQRADAHTVSIEFMRRSGYPLGH
jgi:hypothetical protein